ncbi:aconitate hydratase AcnA [Pseudoduganella namucuonensis]|uniref:Aconitate hydratase A n=1 Tax=Pseudoduganella namucuonensis TaxID=1035707 RepID=A0A1I7KSH4_9BURK|nr:aconitate hydratase AcnA [Pseudoduganella namucuonensis]SFV00380.1 aconitase [Pseudoduganella namucuonensis]
MKTNNLSYSPGAMIVNGTIYKVVDLPALFGERLDRLPYVLRILLENTIRNANGEERDAAVAALFGWLEQGSSEAEIAFQPGRVLMHDTTATPALVDIAAMRDALAEAGADPSRLNPMLPVDVSVDHSLAVEAFAARGAAEVNLGFEMRRNEERYRFLRWASKALDGVRIHPPGTGIMHTINLEQLATVVATQPGGAGHGATPWAMPDTLIGTDSHTPMVNGIGVLGWGVGGLEAQTVMFGMPVMLRIPDVVGVRLLGRLRAPAMSTDLALTVTQRLRELDVTGDFVEFFGPGVAGLTAGDRAVVANMAPEYGATCGYFAIDAQTLAYLGATGRSQAQIALVRTYAQRTGLWGEPAHEARYTKVVEIDLDEIGLQVAGPARPQDRMRYSQVPAALAELKFKPAAPQPAAASGTDPRSAHRELADACGAGGLSPGLAGDLPLHPVAIAAITSCTNTSDPRLLVAAGLVARKARALGMAPAPWTKTSLAPGSPAASSYLERAGLLDDLEALGFGIVGYGCTTCIGNSGPLTAPMRAMLDEGSGRPVAMLSGNRNFPGRVHPDLDLGFIMSPPLVVAYALAGDAMRDLCHEPVGMTAGGKPVYLGELWPDSEEIEHHLRLAGDSADFRRDFERATLNPAWHALESPVSALFPWDPASNYLQRPPFAAATEGTLLGRYAAYPLLVLGDDVTTDHISPASAIPPGSLVADYLVERGEERGNLNVFASRRGNWQVMLRAAFHNRTLVNHLYAGLPLAHTLHVPSGDVLPIWQAAQRYRDDGDAVVLVAGERYGTGSSRDWAAKGLRLLGVRAVLAVSFERIHRSNLIGMGILPLLVPPGALSGDKALQALDRIVVEAPAGSLRPRQAVRVEVWRADGAVETVGAVAAVETLLETRLLADGGVMPSILKRTLTEGRAAGQPA